MITVCIPVFNEQRFLRESVQSVLDQDCDDFIIHLSDNGSTDATQAIAEELAQQDSRIFYTRQPCNIGASANFAYLLRRVRTPWVMLMSGHDLLKPNCLSHLLSLHLAHPQAALVYSTNVMIDPDGEVKANRFADSIDTRQLRRVQASRLILTRLFGNMVYGMYNTERLKRCNLEHVCRGSDHTLIYELSFQGDLICCQEPLYGLRSMGGINRPVTMGYREFCCSQLLRMDPAYFERGPRRVHWEWFAEHLRILRRARLEPLQAVQQLVVLTVLFCWRWKRSLLEEIIRPLSPLPAR